MNARSIVRPMIRTEISRMSAQPSRDAGRAADRFTDMPTDRSFKVLQPSRTPSQLSLFPPPGLAQAPARGR